MSSFKPKKLYKRLTYDSVPVRSIIDDNVLELIKTDQIVLLIEKINDNFDCWSVLTENGIFGYIVLIQHYWEEVNE